jgi:FixJ family two-component response regulator
MVNAQSSGIVAVIDDDADMRDVICDLLQSEGHVTEAYESGVAFLREGGDSRAACIVVDQDMPGMTGEALLRELATRGSEAPALLITGDPGMLLLATAGKTGDMTVMAKPMRRNAFLNFVSLASA